MVTYHRVSLRLSRLQRRKLLMKRPVHVQVNLSKAQVNKHGRAATSRANSKLGQLSEIFLNGHQMRAFRNRHAKGKGYRLKFDNHQLAHNVKYGSGFTDLLGKAANAMGKARMMADTARQAYNDYVPKAAQTYIEKKGKEVATSVGKKATDAILNKIKGGSLDDYITPFVQGKAKEYAGKALQFARDQTGLGVKKRGRGRPKKGRGIVAPGGGGIEAPGWKGGGLSYNNPGPFLDWGSFSGHHDP